MTSEPGRREADDVPEPESEDGLRRTGDDESPATRRVTTFGVGSNPASIIRAMSSADIEVSPLLDRRDVPFGSAEPRARLTVTRLGVRSSAGERRTTSPIESPGWWVDAP